MKCCAKTVNIFAFFHVFFALLLYVRTMAPTILLWDAGEWVTAAYVLGNSHPPGAPLYLLLARVFAMLPFGEIAWRVNLLSALPAAASQFFVFHIIYHACKQFLPQLKLSDWQILFISSFATFSITVSYTFWFNAVGAEVYTLATLLSVLVIYFLLLWMENPAGKFADRYVLMIFYLFGLSLGVHFLVLLLLPGVLWIVLRKVHFAQRILLIAIIFTAIYAGLVNTLPKLAAHIGGWIYISIPVLFLGMLLLTAVLQKRTLQFAALAAIVVLLGFSTFSVVPIRAALHSQLQQNAPVSPQSFADYISRSQYGKIQQLPRRFAQTPLHPQEKFADLPQQWQFFMRSQLGHLYARYVLWQLQPPASNHFFFPALLFLLTIPGFITQFKYHKSTAIAFLLMFVFSSIMVVWYLNQPNPQPRERDYIYVNSFIILFLWMGIGSAALISFIKIHLHKNLCNLCIACLCVIGSASLLNTAVYNFSSHDQSHNTFALDYATNLLQTCESNAILFTGGDNDTYPLWYAQIVRGQRPDVSVVNLSLLQDDAYLAGNPPVAASVLPLQAIAKQPLTFFLPMDSSQVKIALSVQAGEITTQTQRAWNIVQTNCSHRPVYFASGVAEEEMLGLVNLLRLDGLAYKLVPQLTQNGSLVDTEILAENLAHYSWPSFAYPNNIMQDGAAQILQQYQIAYMLLVENYVDANNLTAAASTLQEFNRNLPFSRYPLPRTRQHVLLLYSQIFELTGQPQMQLEMARLAWQYLPLDEAVYENLQQALLANNLSQQIYELQQKWLQLNRESSVAFSN